MVVAQSAPDGFTLLCLHPAALVQTVLRDSLKYSLKSSRRSSGSAGYPMALVVPASSKIMTIDDVKAIATKPEGISFASAGAGTMAHLAAVRFLKAIGGHGLHVTYKNNPEGMQSLVGGYTQMMFPSAREATNLRGDGLAAGEHCAPRVYQRPEKAGERFSSKDETASRWSAAL